MVTAATDPVLTRYLALDEDLVALSAETGQSIPALLDWLHTPEIARTVARFRAHRAHQLTTFALQALAAIISSTPDLIEQRRAATTILKTLTGPATPRPRTRPSDRGTFDDEDDLQDYNDDLAEDDLDEDDPNDSTEANDLADSEKSDDSANLESAAAQVQANVEHDSAAVNIPRATSDGSAGRRALPLSNQHSAREASEAEQMRIYDNRYADDYLPPIPQSTGPPR